MIIGLGQQNRFTYTDRQKQPAFKALPDLNQTTAIAHYVTNWNGKHTLEEVKGIFGQLETPEEVTTVMNPLKSLFQHKDPLIQRRKALLIQALENRLVEISEKN